MDQQLTTIAEIWRASHTLGARLALVRAAGVSWRVITRATDIPTSTARHKVTRYLASEGLST